MSKPVPANGFARLQTIRELELSPQGDLAVITVGRIDEKRRKSFSNLWWSRGGAPARRITWGDCHDSQPRFSPDGRRIAFLSNRGDPKITRFHLLPTEGGEAEPTGPEFRGEIAVYEWSPDGRSLYYSFRPADEPVKDPDGKPEAPQAREIERLFYRLDGEGWRPKASFDLYCLDLGRGTTRRLTDDRWENAEFVLHPDGQRLFFTTCRREDPDFESEWMDIYELPLGKGPERRLTTPDGPKYALVLSPDGKRLAWLGHTHPDDPTGRAMHLFLHDLEQDATRDLTGDDFEVGGGVIDDVNGHLSGDRPQFSSDGSRIIFNLCREGRVELWELELAEQAEPRPLVRGLGSANLFRLHPDGGLHYTWTTLTSPGELYYKPRSGDPRRLSSLNTRPLAAWGLPAPERFRFRSADGMELQGWLLKPADFDPAKRYPAVLEVHGGPHCCYGESLLHEFHYLAGRGFVVLWTNPRGSTSFGEPFTRAIVNDWGNVDFADVMALADHAAGLPFVDAKRMGITGGSYGGFMTNWVIGHTDRFAAAVTQRSVTNLVDFYGSSDSGFWFYYEFGFKHPWSDPEHFWKMSPLASAERVKTPTLILHSEGDLRCPISQGEQLFIALKTRGVPTKLVRFPEESHDLSRSGRPDRRVRRLEEIAGWLELYLKPEPGK